MLLSRLSYINWMWYAWGALMISQFKGTQSQTWDGSDVLEYFSLADTDEWAFVGYSALFFFAFLLITWAALVLMKHQKR